MWQNPNNHKISQCAGTPPFSRSEGHRWHHNGCRSIPLSKDHTTHCLAHNLAWLHWLHCTFRHLCDVWLALTLSMPNTAGIGAMCITTASKGSCLIPHTNGLAPIHCYGDGVTSRDIGVRLPLPSSPSHIFRNPTPPHPIQASECASSTVSHIPFASSILRNHQSSIVTY